MRATTWFLAWTAASACAPTVPEVLHKQVLSTQQARYEQRLKRLEEERQSAAGECARADADAQNREAGLAERLSRLEAALADKQRLIEEAGERIRARGPGGAPSPGLTADLAKLRAGLEGAEVVAIAGRPVLRVPAEALFPSSAMRLGGRAVEALGHLAAELRKLPAHRVRIELHTDAIRPAEGTPADGFGSPSKGGPDTWELAQRQGLLLARALAAAGLDPSRIEIVAAGEYRPVASNDTPEGRARNRRIEIALTPLLP